MPHTKNKEHKRGHQSGSRWHNIHFSGKLIVCSVIFGMLLILIGGIVMAIGMDRDSDDDINADDNYDDIQKKPPMQYVGPVIMGIGGFTVIVGVFMCLIETKVCRRMGTDASPLITNQEAETVPKDIQTSDQSISSSYRNHKHRHGNRKKSPSPRRSKQSPTNKSPSCSSAQNVISSSSESQPTTPINVVENNSKNFLNISDKFLTPPDTFNQISSNANGADHQTSTSLMKSFTSSGNTWTRSTEFQTPDTSFKDSSTSLESSHRSNDFETSLSASNTPILSNLVDERHAFLTPKSSYLENVISSTINNEMQEEILDSQVTHPLSNEIIGEIQVENLKQNKEDKVVLDDVIERAESKRNPFLSPVKEKNEPVLNLERQEDQEIITKLEKNIINENFNSNEISVIASDIKETKFDPQNNNKIETEIKSEGEAFFHMTEQRDGENALKETNILISNLEKENDFTEVYCEASTKTIKTATKLPEIREDERHKSLLNGNKSEVSSHQITNVSNGDEVP